MNQLRVDYSNFSLVSSWTVSADGTSHSTPSIAQRTVTFEYQLPKGAKVKSAKVYARWGANGDPWGDYQIRTIDEKDAKNGYVDVDIDPAGTSKSVVFMYQSWGDNTHTSGTATITDVYLLIVYSTGASIYRAENGTLVPYNFFRAESGVLVPYQVDGVPGVYDGQQFYTASGERLCTVDRELFKITG